MSTLSISELFETIFIAKTKAEKISLLQQYSRKYPTFLYVIRLVRGGDIKWLLPDEIIYTPCSYLDLEGMFWKEVKRLYLFIEGGNSNLTDEKRTKLFIQLLESIDAKDAEFLMAAKNKKFTKPLSDDVILTAFPGLYKK